MLNIQKQKEANIALAIEDVEAEEVDRVAQKMQELKTMYDLLTTGKDKSDDNYSCGSKILTRF